jgi:hypothetical protein
MARCHPSTRHVNRGRALSARLATYRRHHGRFVISHTSGLRLTFTTDPGAQSDRSGPVVVVGCRYPWRQFIADLHELADNIEFGCVDGPADFLSFEESDTEPEDAA